MAEERLQKIMASAGVGSRRACEKLILAGRVQVGGHTVTELGTKADPELVAISVDGKPLRFHERYVYLKVHKPRGVISDIGGDTRGRKSISDLISLPNRRVFPVGRLDLNSEGLVLLTDDGALAHVLTHPRFQHQKTYYVLVHEQPTVEALNRLHDGIELEDGMTAPAEVRIANTLPSELRLEPGPNKGVWLQVGLREGRKHQIRHMTAAIGYPTLRLVRWSIDTVELGSLAPGASEHLSRKEVAEVRKALFEQQKRNKQKRTTGKPGNQRNKSRTDKSDRQSDNR